MLRTSTFFGLCVALLVLAGSASAAYVTHSGSADPLTESWTWNSQEFTTANWPTQAAGNDNRGYWGMTGADGQGGGYSAPATSAELTADWRFTAVVKVVNNDPAGTAIQGNVTMVAADSDVFLNMKISEDEDTSADTGVWQYQDDNSVWVTLTTLDTSEYHRYDVIFGAVTNGVATATDTYTFYVDMDQVAQVNRSGIRTHSFDSIFWGDVANSGASESRWSFVEFTNDLVHCLCQPPGDFDSDWDVDSIDFGIWQTGYPTASGAFREDGDADDDGDVDSIDFGIWQVNYPTAAPGAVVGGAAVPEPATLGLLIIGGITLLHRRPRK